MKWFPLNLQLMSVWQNWFIVTALVWLGFLAITLIAVSSSPGASTEEQ